MTARKVVDTQVATDASKTASTGFDSQTVTVNAASSFSLTLDKYTDYNHLVIHITNSGALTALTGTFAITCGTIGSTVTLPGSPVTVAGSLANPAAVASYDSLIIIKSGFFTKLKLSYTATSGSGSLSIRITGSNID